MEILSDYRITVLDVSERELVLRAERARVADERAQQSAGPVTATGSLSIRPLRRLPRPRLSRHRDPGTSAVV